MKRTKIFCISLLLLAGSLTAQNTTFSPEEKKAPSPSAAVVKDARMVLVIPFEPRLYNSEIDLGVNKETKMNQHQIRNAFRSGLDFSVVSVFKKKYSVYSLLNDTGASGIDQRYIYESIAYNYVPLPDPANASATAGKKNKKTDEDKPKIQNGQLTVTTSDQKKFMNVKITNPNLLNTLNKRYGAAIFVFISQLDINVQADTPEQYSSGNAGRIVGIHYTIFDLSGNAVSAGLSVQHFPAGLNNPTKIVNTYFTEAAQAILDNYLLAISPKPVKGGN